MPSHGRQNLVGNSKLQSDLSEGDFCDALKLIVLSRGGSDNVKIFNKG